MAERCISLRGVEVHNLKEVDLDIPHRRLIAVCGVSGSGKTSLALDTLYAEGQRRYIESFSAYTRQFLERLEKPAARSIEGIPPAVAVTAKTASRSSRSTVGTATEIADYLRLLYAKIGRVICQTCGQEVRRDTPQSIADLLAQLPQGARFMVAFPLTSLPARGEAGSGANAETTTQVSFLNNDEQPATATADPFSPAALVERGFVRAIVGGRLINLSEPNASLGEATEALIYVVVDRLTAGSTTPQRLRDSLETALAQGGGAYSVFVESAARPQFDSGPRGAEHNLDGAPWWRLAFSDQYRCDECGREYPVPEPRLYSFNSPLGACPTCEGFGNVIDVDMELVVPNRHKTLREGAIAAWTTPAYEHELQELVALAPDYGVPLDVPFESLTPEQLRIVEEGVPERKFGGLKGFFRWLERRKYKLHVRAFYSRWRSARLCPACNGNRLQPEALATRIGGLNIAEATRLKISDAARFFRQLELTESEQTIGRMMLEQVRARLGYLEAVGLGYLSPDRTLKTLSGGESQRVALTAALGSSLVGMLYVLDEPSTGLHPRDVDRLIDAVRGLRDRGNTVVVVEHEESLLRAADQVIEIGPGAGERGGHLVFQGTPAALEANTKSLTGDYLAGRRGVSGPPQRRTNRGSVRIAGARGNNLKNITVEFPLGVLCVVTGVSGSGKSTLVEDTLYPALKRRMREEAPKPYDHDDVFGDGQLDDVILVDQSPIGRSPRSNPVTYIKAFDEIRAVFADTIDARTRNFTASHFSFNVEGGRCEACQGEGYIAIDMQFLADVFMKCSQCQGRRYRPEILKIQYRNRNIAEVLDMTVREAFAFFRGSPKVQARLKRLIDVGLDYVRLGQPANTLSGGEAQRLKLAGHLSAVKRARSLFILDEPTTGLHFADVVRLVDCFDALLAVGHSLIVVEHNLQLMKAADYIIDLGPGAADEGGQVIAQGTPERVAQIPESATGQALAAAFARDAEAVSSFESRVSS